MILFRSKLNNSFRIESDFGGKNRQEQRKMEKTKKNKTEKKTEIKTSGSEKQTKESHRRQCVVYYFN